jgi:ABC-type branched-subunit amino acid transport system permease subunit
MLDMLIRLLSIEETTRGFFEIILRGAYVTAFLTTRYGILPWLGLVVGVVIAALAALTIGAIMMRLSGHCLPLDTMA